MMSGGSRSAVWRLGVLAVAVIAAVGFVFAEVGPNLIGKTDPTATPVPTTTSIGDIPLPMNCLVEPRELSALLFADGTPIAVVGTPAASPTTLPSLFGTPADPATITAIKDTYREVTACLNAGQFSRVVALYSDAYARNLVVNAATATKVDAQVIAAILATPAPLPATQWIAIRAMGGIQELSDGRASAVVVTQRTQSTTPPEPRVIIFTKERGRWVVDDIITVPNEATPTGSPTQPENNAG